MLKLNKGFDNEREYKLSINSIFFKIGTVNIRTYGILTNAGDWCSTVISKMQLPCFSLECAGYPQGICFHHRRCHQHDVERSDS